MLSSINSILATMRTQKPVLSKHEWTNKELQYNCAGQTTQSSLSGKPGHEWLALVLVFSVGIMHIKIIHSLHLNCKFIYYIVFI